MTKSETMSLVTSSCLCLMVSIVLYLYSRRLEIQFSDNLFGKDNGIQSNYIWVNIFYLLCLGSYETFLSQVTSIVRGTKILLENDLNEKKANGGFAKRMFDLYQVLFWSKRWTALLHKNYHDRSC